MKTTPATMEFQVLLPEPQFALSVRQPWAWLLFHGKDVENRTWKTAFRGRFFVHASQGMTREEYEAAVQFVRRFNAPLAAKIPLPHALLKGGVIGRADLTDCRHRTQRDAWASPWFEGPFGFGVANQVELPFRPCRGALGFFRPDFT